MIRPMHDRPRQAPIELGRLFDKLPPHSVEAEAALLGAMILDEKCIDEVVGILDGPDDFYKPAHQAIYAALANPQAIEEPAWRATVSPEVVGVLPRPAK